MIYLNAPLPGEGRISSPGRGDEAKLRSYHQIECVPQACAFLSSLRRFGRWMLSVRTGELRAFFWIDTAKNWSYWLQEFAQPVARTGD